MEELEAADWYDQRAEAARDDGLRHAAMLLEWLRRRDSFAFGKEVSSAIFEAALRSLREDRP
ncbi:MAG: hypothetical protein ACREYF_16395 [Gammaproteobacteria bacterium]